MSNFFLDKLKNYLSLLVFATLYISACQEVQPCEAYRRRFFDKSVVEVVTDKGPEGNYFLITGFDPISHRKVVFDGLDSFYIRVKERMNIGDTLIKTKGNASFLLKKKTMNIIVSYDCTNKADIFRTDTLTKKDASLIPNYFH